MSSKIWLGLVVCAGVGCASPGSSQDSIDDRFLGADGKADTGIEEGSAEARGMLTLVNTRRYRELKEQAGLYSNAAWNIVMHRAGADRLDNTADDDPFDSLAELDAVSYVGTVTFEKLLAYAYELGLVVDGPGGTLLERIAVLEGMFPSGHGAGRVDVTSAVPLTMLGEYMDITYEPEDYEIVENATEFETDVMKAGTVTLEAAHAAVSDGIEYVDSVAEEEESTPRHQAEAAAALDAIVEAGAILGFDGWGQSGCAAPTPVLVIIDTEAKFVYGIDLNPCSES
jgi:hypothetical protein